ncbi:MAG: hypothetical protein Q9221_008767 [Calogaya cf. arnoldii]
MPEIYSLAQGVTVWLGPESEDSNIAMKIFNEIGPDVIMDWTVWDWHVDPSSSLHAHGLVLNSEQLLSITNMLSRLWFKRLWIVYPKKGRNQLRFFGSYYQSLVGKDVSKLQPLCVTLCAGFVSDKSIPPESSRPSSADVLDYLTRLYEWSLLESAEPPGMSYSSLLVIRVINRMTNGRTLITTADGRLGLAPKGTIPGDLICVVLGCHSPLVLRSDNNLSHQVVGACYIDSLMTGEALLGELPRNWSLVSKYFPEHNSGHYILLEGDTGKTHVQDPRLGPLPAGWRIQNHEKEKAVSRYVNDISGEDAGYRDPRLEPDALRARGVDIQEFRLV